MEFNDLKALRLAAMVGRVDVMKQLLNDGRVDMEALGLCLDAAAECGKVKAVEFIFDKCKSSPAQAQRALALSANAGSVDCVRFLMNHCDPKANNSEALANAAAKGSAECVMVILPVSDASAHESCAFRLACTKANWKELVELLYPHSCITGIERGMMAAKQWGNEELYEWIRARRLADKEVAELQELVGIMGEPVKRKSGRL